MLQNVRRFQVLRGLLGRILSTTHRQFCVPSRQPLNVGRTATQQLKEMAAGSESRKARFPSPTQLAGMLRHEAAFLEANRLTLFQLALPPSDRCITIEHVNVVLAAIPLHVHGEKAMLAAASSLLTAVFRSDLDPNPRTIAAAARLCATSPTKVSLKHANEWLKACRSRRVRTPLEAYVSIISLCARMQPTPHKRAAEQWLAHCIRDKHTMPKHAFDWMVYATSHQPGDQLAALGELQHWLRAMRGASTTKPDGHTYAAALLGLEQAFWRIVKARQGETAALEPGSCTSTPSEGDTPSSIESELIDDPETVSRVADQWLRALRKEHPSIRRHPEIQACWMRLHVALGHGKKSQAAALRWAQSMGIVQEYDARQEEGGAEPPQAPQRRQGRRNAPVAGLLDGSAEPNTSSRALETQDSGRRGGLEGVQSGGHAPGCHPLVPPGSAAPVPQWWAQNQPHDVWMQAVDVSRCFPQAAEFLADWPATARRLGLSYTASQLHKFIPRAIDISWPIFLQHHERRSAAVDALCSFWGAVRALRAPTEAHRAAGPTMAGDKLQRVIGDALEVLAAGELDAASAWAMVLTALKEWEGRLGRSAELSQQLRGLAGDISARWVGDGSLETCTSTPDMTLAMASVAEYVGTMSAVPLHDLLAIGDAVCSERQATAEAQVVVLAQVLLAAVQEADRALETQHATMAEASVVVRGLRSVLAAHWNTMSQRTAA